MFTHSSYSLKYGMVDPEELVLWGLQANYKRLVLADINTTSGILNFVRYSQEQQLLPVAGIDIRNGINCCYVLLAHNNHGFQEANRFLTQYLHSGQQFPEEAPDFEQCSVIYPWGKEPTVLATHAYIGIAPHQLNRFHIHPPAPTHQCVAFAPMTFRNKQDFNTHRLLRAIDQNCLLSKLPTTQQTREDERFISVSEWENSYVNFPELCTNTYQLIEKCSIQFEFGDQASSQNLATYTSSPAEDSALLKKLCLEGIQKRYGTSTPAIRDRVEKEITIITQRAYLSYFLIAWDIVSYAQKRGYFHVGRGSGANSIVAYLLGITDVDPLELDLYFERFINLYRKNPPDFDIDFSWRDRDDVIDYIFERFPNAVLLCTYNTFQYRATMRELGKVFGLPKSDIDALCDSKKTGMITDHMQALVVKYSQLITGLPSYLSIHAGGIIIPEKSIHWFSGSFLPPKGYPTSQFSMLEAEDVGLYKLDILSQRGLGKICEALSIISYNQPQNPPRNIHDIAHFKTDDRINQLLREAKALGCFYVESPAMRMLMIKLHTNSYLELVAASSIIRPGVSSSGMMRQYILRHREPERYLKEAHPVLLEIMPETYGVMIYQEDVIKVAHHFGGLSLAESDVLRRGMSGKFRSRDEFTRVKEQFFANCKAKGYEAIAVKEIWRQIESFAGYAFAKGHSASYAVESYQSLYLKAYYPLEYMVATINNFGGYYRTEIYVHEARKLGGTIEAPCIQYGNYSTTLKETVIYLGFQHINGIEEKIIAALLQERSVNGAFHDFESLLRRVYIPLEQLVLIIRIGGLRTFNIPKKELLWKAHFFHATNKQTRVYPELFAPETTIHHRLPPLTESTREEAFEQMELLDFPLCNPFQLIDEPLQDFVKARELPRYINHHIRTYGYLVTVKKTITSNQQQMLFGTLLDHEGEQIDCVHFPQIAQQFPYRGKGIYELTGKVVSEFDFISIEITSARKIPFCDDPRYSES
jgi:DNA polymerase-3 subunit alpha